MSYLSSNQPGETSSVPIARLFPLDENAKRAVHDLLEDPGLSGHHRSFLQAQRANEQQILQSSSDISSGDRSSEESPASPEEELRAGYYALDFDSSFHIVGWRVGRGSSRRGADRGIDLLICPPERGRKMRVAAVHALIQLHRESGVLMLVGLSDSHPVEYIVPNKRVPLLLRHNEKHVLHQKTNIFSFGKLLFKLVYEEMNELATQQYTIVRDLYLEQLSGRAPHPHLHSVPSESYSMIGDVILHQSIATGAFGWIYAAIHTRSGAPLAVKELTIKSPRDATHPDLKNEIIVSTSFKVRSPRHKSFISSKGKVSFKIGDRQRSNSMAGL